MHIPGKPLMRPKNSLFRNTDARRIAYANHLRREAAKNTLDIEKLMLASQIESGVGVTRTKSTMNQRKRRAARRQAWAAGDRFAFSSN